MSKKYSGRIHDPNHTLSDYDIYYNDDLITGNGMYTIEEIADIFGSATASGNPLMITDAAPLGPVSIDADFPVTVSTANLLKPDELTTQTIAGVTFTPQPDGSIVCSGTATGAASYPIIAAMEYELPYDCVLSGCPAGGSASKYDLRAQYNQSPANYYNDYGSGKEIPSGTKLYRLAILIRSGQDATGLVFYPMLAPKTPAATVYQQYKKEIHEDASNIIFNDGYNIIESDTGTINLEYVQKGS